MPASAAVTAAVDDVLAAQYNALRLDALAARILGVNNGFEIWQRGAGPFTVDGVYTADRWVMDEAGTDALQIDREGTTKQTTSLYSAKAAFTLGTGAGATKYYQQLSINANEPWHGLRGQAVSVGIDVKLNAGVANAVRAFIETDGTGGTTTYSAYHGNNANWETLSVANVTVPSDATYVRYGVAFAASVTCFIDNAMPTLSDVVCPYVAVNPADDLARCQRYYWQWGGNGVNGPIYRASANGAHIFSWPVTHPTTMAVAPTVTKVGTYSVTNCGQPTGNFAGVDGFSFTITASGAGQVEVQPVSGSAYMTIEANP